MEGEVTLNPKVILRTPDLNGRHVSSRDPTVTLILGLQFLPRQRSRTTTKPWVRGEGYSSSAHLYSRSPWPGAIAGEKYRLLLSHDALQGLL